MMGIGRVGASMAVAVVTWEKISLRLRPIEVIVCV